MNYSAYPFITHLEHLLVDANSGCHSANQDIQTLRASVPNAATF